jgi:hypothetical protein
MSVREVETGSSIISFEFRQIRSAPCCLANPAITSSSGQRRGARRRKIPRHATSSVQTLKLTNVFGPRVWVIGTSEASRPLRYQDAPMLGTLLRGSKVRQCPPI